MRHGSLFSGIGGFDLAAEWSGWENVFQVEKDRHCLKRLMKQFPNVKRYEDVKTFSGNEFRNTIDILSGGDPCQPHSVAGLGKGTSDNRYLWPEMFRIAQELNVPWIVNENVSGSIANGVLDLKINDLEGVGYTCQAYCIPAEAVGALHQRERVWLIAYDASRDAAVRGSRDIQNQTTEPRLQERNNVQHFGVAVDLRTASACTDSERFEEQHIATIANDEEKRVSRYFGFGPATHGHIRRDIIESGIVRMLNGLPEGMDYADRNQRIKALGNAIVPQIAYEIFKAINKYYE